VTQIVSLSASLTHLAYTEACQAGLSGLDALHIAAAKFSGSEEFITIERPTTIVDVHRGIIPPFSSEDFHDVGIHVAQELIGFFCVQKRLHTSVNRFQDKNAELWAVRFSTGFGGVGRRVCHQRLASAAAGSRSAAEQLSGVYQPPADVRRL
jgi:hypothetical protein